MANQAVLFEQLFESSVDGVLLGRPDGTVLRANPAACRVLGRTEAEICSLGQPGLMVDDEATREFLRRRADQGAVAGELTFRRPDGTTFPADFTSGSLQGAPGDEPHSYLIFRDASGRHHAEAARRRTNRALRLLTLCNEAVARAQSEGALLAEVCRIMVEAGGHRMCWAGLAEEDERLSIRPVAHAGHEDGYLATLDLSWADGADGRGPTGTAVRTGRPVVNTDFATDPTVAAWRQAALARGYRTSSALPLLHEGRRLGVLTLYSERLETFDEAELAILGQLAADVAYGVAALRQREAHGRAEAALRASEARLREAQRSAQIGSWRFVPGQPLDWSEQLFDLFKLPRDAPPTLEAASAQVLPQDRHLGPLAAIREALTSGAHGLRSEYRVVWPDGQVRTLLSRGEIRRSPSGEVTEAVGTVQDVTERKRDAAERERLAMALEQAAEMVVVADAQGTVVYVNQAFEQVTGYPRAEVLGQAAFAETPGQGIFPALREAIAAGRPSRGRYLNRRKDGAEYSEEAAVSLVRDAAGAIDSYVAVKRDISRDLAREAELLQAQKMETVGRLAGGVAHDFNNLLSVILSYAGFTLEQLPPGDPLRVDVQEIENAARRAAALTRQLLAFSRKQILQPVPLDLNLGLAEVEKMLRRLLGEDIDLVLLPAAGLWTVRADPGQFEQVIMNLVVNARDAMPAGGRLTISTANRTLDAAAAAELRGVQPGPHVMVTVADSGTGMAPEVLARLFEPFFTTKPAGKGSGLGLSTVYGIVQQSGGAIQVQSEVGRGTTFRILLPRLEAAAEAGRGEAATGRPGGAETILVVEDDRTVLAVATRILEGAGYRVLGAPDGGAALLICERHPAPIDLALTDVVMPNMGGRAFADALTRSRPAIKVVFMSGYTDDDIASHGVLRPGIAFIAKPLTRSTLLRKVREVLDG